jgi:hypothetical protein
MRYCASMVFIDCDAYFLHAMIFSIQYRRYNNT